MGVMDVILDGCDASIYSEGSTVLADQLKGARAIAAMDLRPPPPTPDKTPGKTRYFAVIGPGRMEDNPYKLFRLVVGDSRGARTEGYDKKNGWTMDMYYTRYLESGLDGAVEITKEQADKAIAIAIAPITHVCPALTGYYGPEPDDYIGGEDFLIAVAKGQQAGGMKGAVAFRPPPIPADVLKLLANAVANKRPDEPGPDEMTQDEYYRINDDWVAGLEAWWP